MDATVHAHDLMHFFTVDQVDLDERQVWIGAPESNPDWLLRELSGLLGLLPCVEMAYLVEVRPPEDMTLKSLVSALGVTPTESERVVRAAITHNQPLCDGLDMEVDLTVFNPTAGLPECLHYLDAAPLYRRAKTL